MIREVHSESKAERDTEGSMRDSNRYIDEEAIYNQHCQDWRHRDNLTWQIPTVAVTIGGALIVAAFSGQIESEFQKIIRPILLGIGMFFSLALSFALIQNLEYQIATGKAIDMLSNGQVSKPMPIKSKRTLSLLKDVDLNLWDCVKQVGKELKGSALLAVATFLIFIILLAVFGYSIYLLVTDMT